MKKIENINLKTKIISSIVIFLFLLYWINKFFDNFRINFNFIEIRLKSPIERRLPVKQYPTSEKQKKSQEEAKFGQILASSSVVETSKTRPEAKELVKNYFSDR